MAGRRRPQFSHPTPSPSRVELAGVPGFSDRDRIPTSGTHSVAVRVVHVCRRCGVLLGNSRDCCLGRCARSLLGLRERHRLRRGAASLVAEALVEELVNRAASGWGPPEDSSIVSWPPHAVMTAMTVMAAPMLAKILVRMFPLSDAGDAAHLACPARAFRRYRHLADLRVCRQPTRAERPRAAATGSPRYVHAPMWDTLPRSYHRDRRGNNHGERP